MKKHLPVLIITSLIILLPIVAGLLLWNQLPNQIPTHWNASGQVDGWSSKAFAVFGLGGILLAVQWLCAFATFSDPKKANHSPKLLQIVFWIIPVLTVVIYTATYLTALGKPVQMDMITPLLMGFILVVIGVYLPKCKQNYTIGIKLPWTLSSEENWNKTHKFASPFWVIGGLVTMVSGIFGYFWFFIVALTIVSFAPTIYSYILHCKGI